MHPITKALQNTLTVKDLIDELNQYPPETRVVVEVPAKDHWGTLLAKRVESVEGGPPDGLKWSDYHSSLIIPENPNDDLFNPMEPTVVIHLK